MRTDAQPSLNTVRTRVLLVLLLALACGACSSTVGDPCTTNADCAFGHSCDLSSPGGYCLVNGCRANSCPSQAWCATFQFADRTQSFCLRKCTENGDCRDGYVCRFDVGSPGGVCYQPNAESS